MTLFASRSVCTDPGTMAGYQVSLSACRNCHPLLRATFSNDVRPVPKLDCAWVVEMANTITDRVNKRGHLESTIYLVQVKKTGCYQLSWSLRLLMTDC